MGKWHYQIKEFRYTDVLDVARTYYQIVEVYSSGAQTSQGIMPMGETPEELIRDLERMLDEGNKLPVLPFKDADSQ
jgi:hypothetical protein